MSKSVLSKILGKRAAAAPITVDIKNQPKLPPGDVEVINQDTRPLGEKAMAAGSQAWNAAKGMGNDVLAAARANPGVVGAGLGGLGAGALLTYLLSRRNKPAHRAARA